MPHPRTGSPTTATPSARKHTASVHQSEAGSSQDAPLRSGRLRASHAGSVFADAPQRRSSPAAEGAAPLPPPPPAPRSAHPSAFSQGSAKAASATGSEASSSSYESGGPSKSSRSASLKGLFRTLGKAVKLTKREMQYRQPLKHSFQDVKETVTLLRKTTIPKPKEYSLGRLKYASNGKGKVMRYALSEGFKDGRHTFKFGISNPLYRSLIKSYKAEMRGYTKEAFGPTFAPLINAYRTVKNKFMGGVPRFTEQSTNASHSAGQAQDSNAFFDEQDAKAGRHDMPDRLSKAGSSVTSEGSVAPEETPDVRESQSWSSVGEWVEKHARAAARYKAEDDRHSI
jgi:hypothetical protein